MLAALARADVAAFDLTGPRIDVRVQRNGVTLPISEVPNLGRRPVVGPSRSPRNPVGALPDGGRVSPRGNQSAPRFLVHSRGDVEQARSR